MANTRHAYPYHTFDEALTEQEERLVITKDEIVIWSLADRVKECKTDNSYYTLESLIEEIVNEVYCPSGITLEEAKDIRTDLIDMVTTQVYEDIEEE